MLETIWDNISTIDANDLKVFLEPCKDLYLYGTIQRLEKICLEDGKNLFDFYLELSPDTNVAIGYQFNYNNEYQGVISFNQFDKFTEVYKEYYL